MIYAVLNGGQVVEWRDIQNWGDYPAHKKAAADEKGDGGPVLRPRVDEGNGSVVQIIVEPTQVRVVRSSPLWSDLPAAEKRSYVDRERDRRLSAFRFGGVTYDFDDRSANRIDKARGSALAAVIAGAQPNDFRWADPNVDFGWIAADNTFHTMDAQTTLAFGNAAAAWEGLHIIAARTLKDMTNIPGDYVNDSYWPAG